MVDCRRTLSKSEGRQIRLGIRDAERILRLFHGLIQRFREWEAVATNLGIRIEGEPQGVGLFDWKTPFLGLKHGPRPFHHAAELYKWLQQCCVWLLEISAFCRMLQFQVLDAMCMKWEIGLPCYAVDEEMVGIIYANSTAANAKARRTLLIRHGVPYFDIITRSPFPSLGYPAKAPQTAAEGQLAFDKVVSGIVTQERTRFRIVFEELFPPSIHRPADWVVVPPKSPTYHMTYPSFLAVVQKFLSQSSQSHNEEVVDTLAHLAGPSGGELDGFYPMKGGANNTNQVLCDRADP